MKICIAGWYLDSELYEKMRNVNGTAFVVSHNLCSVNNDKDEYSGILSVTIENIGLEFHCYNYYLQNIWDKKSDVLFMHDDIHIDDVSVFDDIETLTVDQAYIFNNPEEERRNGGKHGRMIYMSAVLLWYLYQNGGIWYDNTNHGYIGAGEKRPAPDMDFNAGINHFHKHMGRIRDDKSLDFNVVNRVFFDKIKFGKRGHVK